MNHLGPPDSLDGPGESGVKSPRHRITLCRGLISMGASPSVALHDISGSSGPWDEVLLVALLLLVVVVLAVLGVVKGREGKSRR